MSSTDKLAAARQRLKESGKSPVEIGKKSKLAVLDWIYRWGFTSAAMISALLGRTSGGYAQRLVRQGLLVRINNGNRTPKELFTLSDEGLRIAEKHSDRQAPYPELNPQRVRHHLINHDLVAQLETISALKDKWAVKYITDRFYDPSCKEPGIKIPDVVWLTNPLQGRHLMVAVEIELSPKWERDLDMFILGMIRALEFDGYFQPYYDHFVIIFDSEATLKRYQSAIQPNAIIRTWVKNKRNYWVVEKKVIVPHWLCDKVTFRMIGEKVEGLSPEQNDCVLHFK